jgi:CheY-like chemotaxis protein
MGTAKILLVDDNTADINLLRLALDQQGEQYELEVLRSGEDALQFVREHREGLREPDPCVILLDLHLPRHDGLAILDAIRQSSNLGHIHVVILSGLASPAEKERISRLGGLYVQKPFRLTEFMELGAQIIAICRSASPVPA